VLFLLVRAINAARRPAVPAPAAAAPTPEEVVLLREIRDALKR
jgi:large conductance mechanosensitive channel